MNRQLTTRTDVDAEITDALGEHAHAFNIDRIADRAYEWAPELGCYVQLVDTDGFWKIAENAAYPLFTGEFQDDAWTAPADDEHEERDLETFLITPEDEEATEDIDMAPTHRGGTLLLSLAIPVTDEWEPEVYARHIEAAGWKILRPADDAQGEWILTPATEPTR